MFAVAGQVILDAPGEDADRGRVGSRVLLQIRGALSIAFDSRDAVASGRGERHREQTHPRIQIDNAPVRRCRVEHRDNQIRQQKTIAAVYRAARACFFVSEHNRRLTEEQLGFQLPRAAVVRNPFLVSWEPRTDWPDDRSELRLACVGRLHPKEKGQDLLLRVLARRRWRDRPLSVTFYGEGLQRASLERMASNLNLTNVSFAGFVGDVLAIWSVHHGLILPSRCEGLPIVLVEAMLSGRVPVVTNVGGNAEVVDDGITGYLAAAPTEDALDEAMERAWSERHRWREVGAAAAARIRTLIPREPERCFATRLVELASSAEAL